MQRQDTRVLHKGLFIADERRKGDGGRIKSQSIPNKIDVQLSRDQRVLHESEVEWVEIRRYNRKEKRQGRGRKPGPKEGKAPAKKEQFKQKVSEGKQTCEKKQVAPQKNLKYVAKEEIQASSVKEEKPSKEETFNELSAEPETREEIEQVQPNRESEDGSDSDKDEDHREGEELQEKKEEKEEKEVGEKDEQTLKKGEEEKKKREQEEKKKKEEQDIVVVGRILKQVSNPFWKKPFVGILNFVMKKNPKKRAGNDKSGNIRIILQDFYLDVYPIHMRLPKLEVNSNKESEDILEKYVNKNVVLNMKEKAGKIRNQILDELQEVYALVSFDQWYKGQGFCHLLKIIGKAKTIEGECNCFLYEHELNDFDHEEDKAAEKPTLSTNEIYKPFKEMVFTIDPLTSTDLDDALSVHPISENEFQIGIHIADVSAFLSLINRDEVLKRTTSVYLPHKVYHMLPANLVQACSLNPGQLRQAFSIFVRMNDKGEILGESRLEKNILTSRFKLAYEQAQKVLDKQLDYTSFNALHACSEEEFNQVADKLRILEKVGIAHRKDRLVFDVFENRQLKFELNEDKWPMDYRIDTRLTTQKIVEEFMIIGNIEAAKKIVQHDPRNSLVIHHPSPSALGRKQFAEYFETLKMDFHFDDIRELQEDLMKVSQMKEVPQQVKLLCYFKARRVQETANYKRYSDIPLEGPNKKIHFALGLQFYTHFTSPMRRIGDILVHEVLNSVVDSSQAKKEVDDKEIEQANWGRKNTKRLKKDLNEMYLCLMIYKTKKTIESEGIISSFGLKSVSVYIPLLDTMKEVMWSDLDVYKVVRDRKDSKKFEVILYLDKRDARKDEIWKIEKFEKVPIVIGCTEFPPLRMELSLKVKTNFGISTIYPLKE